MKYKEIENLTIQLYNELDSTIESFIKNNKVKIDCQKGCSLCCKTPSRIEVLPTEAFYIASHIKNTFKKKDLDILIKKLYENKIKLENKNLVECNKVLTPCPLLISDSCSIYHFRPFVCRLLLSEDYNRCLEYNSSQKHSTTLLNNVFDTNIYIKYVEAIKENNFFYEPIEINDALYTLLNTENQIIKILNI